MDFSPATIKIEVLSDTDGVVKSNATIEWSNDLFPPVVKTLSKCELICQLLISVYFYSSIKLIKNIFIIVISIKAKPF
jgi:hypothetical protein